MKILPHRSRLLFFALLTALPSEPSFASEVVTYTYDALGRLKSTTHSGSVNNGIQKGYDHDAADNRTNVTVTGSFYYSNTRYIPIPFGGAVLIRRAP